MSKAHAPQPGAPPVEPAKGKIDSQDALLYAGVALIVAGTAWLSVAAAVIVFGIALVALAFLSE